MLKEKTLEMFLVKVFTEGKKVVRQAFFSEERFILTFALFIFIHSTSFFPFKSPSILDISFCHSIHYSIKIFIKTGNIIYFPFFDKSY